MPLRDRYKAVKNDLKQLLGVGSKSGSSISLHDDRSQARSPSPMPRAGSRTGTPMPANQQDAPLATISPQVHNSQTLNSSQNVKMTAASMPSASLASTPAIDGNVTSVAVQGPIEVTKTVAWPGLKTLMNVLNSSANVFLPLSSALDVFSTCIEIFEASSSASKGQKEYEEMYSKLDSLLGDLSVFIGDPAGSKMTMSMKNLCYGLKEELEVVQAKCARDGIRRHVEALEDAGEITECYQRVHWNLERLALNANLGVWKAIGSLETEARLRTLSPTSMSARYNSAESEGIHRRACTSGTREDELVRLLGWANNMVPRGDESVYWMNGMAGTGKTTIAYSLCARLEEAAKLGASFFCSRQIPECRNVKLIIPAVAYQLARFSSHFCCALMNVLESDPDIQTRGLKIQFENLLVKPLLEVQHTLPADFIVVIDALDECEGGDSIGQILDAIISDLSIAKLPIRFLLSSRPEPQIYDRMVEKSGTHQSLRLVLHELDESKVKRDIETYLRTELEDVHLTPSQLAALVSHSGVLFIYASTAARYIKGGLRFRQHMARLNMVLGLTPPSKEGKDKDIDALYTSILENAFRNQGLDQLDQTLMKSILDTIICAQEPLTTSGISGLLKLADVYTVEGFLGPLRSVINVSETSGLVTTLHASFPDFLRDRGRSASLCCDIQTTHAQTARACLSVISTNSPQFNVCTLISSYLRDNEVPDLATRVNQVIPEQLFYACRYWVTHLELGGEHDDLRELMDEFLSERLLLWMEVLNPKKCMYLGPKIMQRVENWSRTHKCSEEGSDLAHDAWRFVTTFASHAVSECTPHIYVSMLPFWPESAPIAKCYMRKLQGAIKVEGSAMARRQLVLLATWPLPSDVRSVCFSPDESLLACAAGSSVFIIDGTTGRVILGPLDHSDRAMDVVFSKDGARLVSCSEDKTLRVWDTNNGRLMLEPFVGHTDYVTCVSLFPDSRRVASGSRDGTIRVWSLESGCTILGPLGDPDDAVWSVCVSPSGTRIASGYQNGTIHIWDAESGGMLLSSLSGHTNVIQSLCFSPDGARLASGSDDGTVRVWSNLANKVNIEVLNGHSKGLNSVTFSPDGKQVVSGSDDFTVRLWKVEGKPQLIRVLTGHTNNVWSVRFSSDGARIISSSGDRTIRVWDARTQAPPHTPLQGHTQAVTSVAFSHDATRILSGSNDGTIYIWDAHTGQIAVGPMKGHTHWVTSVCFSPDRSRIASGSEDKSVQLWDAYNGQAMGNPMTGHSDSVLSVCFSPDGGLVASGSEDMTIRLWDTQSGEPVGSPLKAHTSWVRSVCFTHDGLRIVSGSSDKTILVWDANTKQPTLPSLKGHSGEIWTVCVSPDGTRIASGSSDKTVRLWNAHSGQSVFGPLLGHIAEIESVCFSPDGSYVVSGSQDKTIRLWDARSGQAVGSPLVGHTNFVRSVAFSPNGGQIVSGSADPSIRVWDIADLVQVKQSQGDDDNATKPPHARPSWVLQDDGWVVDSDSRLLAWVPPDLHASLMGPRNPLLISTQGAVQLDIESAKLGESWTECYTP